MATEQQRAQGLADSAAGECGSNLVGASLIEIGERTGRDTDRYRSHGNRKHRRLGGDGLELVAQLAGGEARLGTARQTFKIAQTPGIDTQWANLADERHVRVAAPHRHLDAAKEDMQSERVDPHGARELTHALAHAERLGAGAQHQAAELDQCVNGLRQRGFRTGR